MNDNQESRPSPDVLLEQANRERRGRLKVFLGAAPGVGKTYSMLRAAQARKQEGIDIVVGVVETHQRSETDALLVGLDIIPRLNIDYRSIAFQEMDLDAILKRAPKLVLVDELAHSNIPGARHPKRYQDVEELLDAGIDVYSTLNVQHMESLNDIVTRITGVTVRETIPDNILQQADSIELIDLAPEELLQRLKEGKVYIPAQAQLAMNRFFTPGNLTALRELALRQAAERVDDQMANYMRSHAIGGPWPTSDRILVCIADDGQAIPLIRTAKRSAERRQAPWLALYIQTHRHASLPDHTRQSITQALHLAEALGGEAMTVASENIAEEIFRIARERNVSVIIIGKSQRTLSSRLIRPSVAAAILDRGGNFDILVTTAHDTKARAPHLSSRTTKPALPWYAHIPWSSYATATTAVCIATIIAWGLYNLIGPAPLPLIYLIGILLVVADHGFWVSAYAGVLSFIISDFLFLEPRFSFGNHRPEDFVTLVFFFVSALAVGIIGDRQRRQMQVTQHNAERTQALYDFNKMIAACATLDDVGRVVVNHVAHSLKGGSILLLPQSEGLEPLAVSPKGVRLDTASFAAMDWAFRHGRPAGFNSSTLPKAPFYGLPLRRGESIVGVLAFCPNDKSPLSSEQEHFLLSLANLSAVAIERAKLASTAPTIAGPSPSLQG
jgi:two-component system, OmpR family, sensor histidine kinase KdpD